MTGLLDYLYGYLEERGWRFVPEDGCRDDDKQTGSWWTRDEFVGWWRTPSTGEISDRYVDLQRAIYEQIEMEKYGVSSVKEMVRAQIKASPS